LSALHSHTAPLEPSSAAKAPLPASKHNSSPPSHLGMTACETLVPACFMTWHVASPPNYQ
jgi:hypothetical protein